MIIKCQSWYSNPVYLALWIRAREEERRNMFNFGKFCLGPAFRLLHSIPPSSGAHLSAQSTSSFWCLCPDRREQDKGGFWDTVRRMKQGRGHSLRSFSLWPLNACLPPISPISKCPSQSPRSPGPWSATPGKEEKQTAQMYGESLWVEFSAGK